MRALGVDFGGKRIGIAVVDTEAGLPTPRPPLAASGKLATDAGALATLAQNEEAGIVVFGLPLRDGEETQFCRVVRQLAGLVEEKGLQVEFVDETLTSHQAATSLRAQGLTGAQSKRRIDSEAACSILDAWVSSMPR